MCKNKKKKFKRAVFLDRDGVINKVVYHNGLKKPSSPWKIEEFEIIKGIKKPLKELQKKGFIIFIISNQPDISRGNIKKGTTEKINKILFEKLPIEDIKVCPHDDFHNCSCRKPKPGMLIDLGEKWDIDLKKSFLIGDSWKDLEAGKRAGVTCILIDKKYNRDVKAKNRVKNLKEVVEKIKLLE